MAVYLSPEWIASAAALVAADAALQSKASAPGMVVEVRAGQHRYHLERTDEHIVLRPGSAPVADVVIDLPVDVAADIAAGRANAQAAFIAGRFRLIGSADVLVGAAELFVALSTTLEPLRSGGA
jgi:hypothetical protein